MKPSIKQPAVDRDGWIRWGGGECPLEAGTMVDVKYRDGFVATNIPAQEKSNWKDSRSAIRWEHYEYGTDIIAYRISATENKETKQELREKMTAAALQGLLAVAAAGLTYEKLAEMAVATADAVIKELDKGRK